MGYAHYWGRPKLLDSQEFMSFGLDVISIINAVKPKYGFFGGIRIVGNGLFRSPKIDAKQVYFNSFPAFETFWIHRDFGDKDSRTKPKEDGLYWDYIKTNLLSHDLVVVACLLALKSRFSEVQLETDGGQPDWKDGHTLFELATGRSIKLNSVIPGMSLV